MARLKDQPKAIREYAERLPDDMFDNDAEVKRLHAEIAAAEKRHRAGVEAIVRADPKQLEAHIEALGAEIQTRTTMREAVAYDDWQRGDRAFGNAVQMRAEIEQLERQLAAARDALKHFELSGTKSALHRETANAADAMSRGRERLAERLEVLKIQAARRAA